MSPNPDYHPRNVRQGMSKSIEELEKQIKLLAQGLFRAELRLKELEAERQGAWKKFSDP
jgi:hypothetical protein